MAESILVTGKKISSMELVTNVTGNEKIPTGQPDDLALTPNQIADHTIARGDLASQEDLSQVEVSLGTQITDLGSDLASDLAAEEAARIAADNLKVDKEGSVSSVAGRVGDVVLVPSDVLVEGFGSQEDVNKYVAKPFLSGYTYGLGERVVLTSGVVVKSTVENNVSNPNNGMVGWVPVVSDSLATTVQTFNTPEAGIDSVTGVADGAYFNVRSEDDGTVAIEYQNIDGSAVATGKSYLSALGVQQQEKLASTIKDESGKSQQDINNNTAQPWYNRSGGYGVNSSATLDNGFNVVSTVSNNTTNPNTDMTGWIFNKNGYVTPQMFGAKGDGVSDDGPAFKRMVQYVVSKAFTPTVGSNRVLGMGILIPATVGGYRISTPQSLIPNLGSTKYVGLSFVGIGLPMIHFDYDGDDYLAYNNNQFLLVSFRNIQFTCNSDTSKFLYSTANGGVQDYLWDNCHWSGKWQKLYVLRGGNNNSEWGWNKCGMAATIRDVMLDIADSDQFLNYWFDQCKLWLYDGQCVRASAGGHIKFINCDWSALGGTRSMCQSTNGKFLFELTGRSHTRGACDFRIIGGRFECKPDSQNTGINARLLYCEWNQGNIELSVDMSSTIVPEFDDEFSISIHRGNNGGPLLKVHDSYLIGRVKLQTFAASFPQKNKAVFDTVTFGSVSLTKPTDFFDISAPSPNPSGGYAVELRNCRPSLDGAAWNNTTRTTIPWDLTLGSKLQHSGAGTVNIAEFKGSAGGNNPISNNPCYLQLPVNSTILGVKIWCDGTGTTTNDSTWVVSINATGTALLTCASHKLNQRWYEETKIPYHTSSGLLKLIDSASGGQSQEIAGFKCVVEYVC